MNKLVIILFLTVFYQTVCGQKFVFTEGGRMRPSKFYIDTVINTDLKLTNRTVFKYLDSFYKDSLHIKKYLAIKYDRILKDTFEYFFVANLTNTNIKFKRQGSRLVAEELARYENFGHKPFSYFNYGQYINGLDCEDFELKPSQILIIKNETKRQKTVMIYKPDTYANLLLANNVVLKSSLYRESTGNANFYIDQALKDSFNFARQKKLVAFDW